jgi:hypothetical protein
MKNKNIISFCHLTQLKTCEIFMEELEKINYDKNIIINVTYTNIPKILPNELLEYNVPTTDLYKKFIKTDIEVISNSIEIINEHNKTNKIDFATIFFNDCVEIMLLKLQAFSFKFVDFQIINNIILFFQDTSNLNIDEIVCHYPENIQNKVKIVLYKETDLDLNYLENGWQLQQLNKILISKYIKAEYYCILDAKNHFIRSTNYDDFFYNNDYYIYTSPGCRTNDFYYSNCTEYFSGKSSTNKNDVSMSSPFIFHKKTVEEMISYIELKEKQKFAAFFMSNSNITEFYLYASFVEFNNCKNVKYNEIIHTTIHSNPNEEWSLKFINEKMYLDKKYKIVGLHRKSIEKMHPIYIHNLLQMYEYVYGKNCQYINNIISHILHP